MTLSSILRTSFCLLGGMCFSTWGVQAQDDLPPTTTDVQTATENGDGFERIASGFEFQTEDGASLKWVSKPLLNFSNPVRSRGQLGSVYLWTLEGRPAVIGSLWSIRDESQPEQRLLSVELHALLPQPLVIADIPTLPSWRRELPDWNPPAASLEFQKVTGGQMDQADERRLRVFSRQVARRFNVEILDNRTGRASTLRLLPQAIYEYQTPEVLWGGIFAFTVATDPEAFLFLEARQHATGVQWSFGWARMTGRRIIARYEGKEVWKVERAPLWTGTGSYLFCVHAATLPADQQDP